MPDSDTATEVINLFLNELPDFVSTSFSTWLPIALQTFSLTGETDKQARDCADAISYHSGVFQTRRDKNTGCYYLKQGKRFKGLKRYRGISLGMARDMILRLLFLNGVPRYYVFARDVDSEMWYLQSTALRHQDAFLAANALATKLGAIPVRVLPCSWPVMSPITTEQMTEEEQKIKTLAWHLDCNQQALVDERHRKHAARMAMSAHN